MERSALLWAKQPPCKCPTGACAPPCCRRGEPKIDIFTSAGSTVVVRSAAFLGLMGDRDGCCGGTSTEAIADLAMFCRGCPALACEYLVFASFELKDTKP